MRRESQAYEAETWVRMCSFRSSHYFYWIITNEQFLPRDTHELPGVRVSDFFDMRVPPRDVLSELFVRSEVRGTLFV